MSNSDHFFDVFPWIDSFATGIPLIDAQHQKLVALINKLASTLSVTANEQVLGSVFAELAAYAEFHFKTEEEIWKSRFNNDEWLQKHQGDHKSFLPAIQNIQEANKDLPYDRILSEILKYLVSWLVYHILDNDKRMAMVIIAMDNGLSAKEAKEQANHQMNGLMKVFIGTVLNMYENVALRSINLIKATNEKSKAEMDLIISEANANAANQLADSMEATIAAMVKAIELRSPYTAGHQQRVASLVERISEKLGLPPFDIRGNYLAAMIHDIGDVYIPTEILTRPRKLESIELKIVQEHAKAGYEILKDVQFPWPIAEIIYQHHERLDGSGYPRGLKGEEILLGASILAVADTIEAMSSHRPYRPAHTLQETLSEIQSKSGIAYDKDVVDACIKVFEEDSFKFENP